MPSGTRFYGIPLPKVLGPQGACLSVAARARTGLSTLVSAPCVSAHAALTIATPPPVPAGNRERGVVDLASMPPDEANKARRFPAGLQLVSFPMGPIIAAARYPHHPVSRLRCDCRASWVGLVVPCVIVSSHSLSSNGAPHNNAASLALATGI